MRAADPAARAAHAAFEFRKCLIDAYTPCLQFLAGRNPANPFTACEWGNIFPYRFGLGR